MELDSNIYSSETEKDTTVNLIIFSFNIKDTLVIISSPPSGNTGGERVALVSGGAGADCKEIADFGSWDANFRASRPPPSLDRS